MRFSALSQAEGNHDAERYVALAGAEKRIPECFDKLSMHGLGSGLADFFPLVLSLSKDSERL